MVRKRKKVANTAMKTTEGFNPLVTILSPRNIPQVREAINTLPFDKLWIKHHPSVEAYPIMDREFKEHTEYTHLIIVPDDLVVPYESLKILIDDLTCEGGEWSMPHEIRENCVVAGYCNVDTGFRSQLSNVSFYPPPVKRDLPDNSRSYASYHFLALDGIQRLQPDAFKTWNPNLFETKFNGLTAWIIPRKVKEKFKFRNDSESGTADTGCCWDVMASYDLWNLRIPIFTDRRVFLQHLRGSIESSRTFTLEPTLRALKWEYANPDSARTTNKKKMVTTTTTEPQVESPKIAESYARTIHPQ